MKSILEINEPFYSAGKKYGWMSEYPSIGVGIALTRFGEEDVVVKVKGNDKYWSISYREAARIVKKYGSTFSTDDGTFLWILPWKAFKEVY